MSISWLAILCALVLVFWALGAYNRLVGLRASVAQHLQTVVQLWHDQAQIICERVEQHEPSGESPSRWATIDEDLQRWRSLALSARQLTACLPALQTQPASVASVENIASVLVARHILEANWQRLSCAQADLAGEPVPADLHLLWSQHELLIKERLQTYDSAVTAYHEAIGQFPASVLAKALGFRPTSSLGERKAPAVLSS